MVNESVDFWVDCHCLLSFTSERFTCLSYFELNVFFIFAYICSQDFSDQVLTVEPTAECFCFHMFSTSFDSDKFGWFGGPVVSSFIFHRKESCQICRCCKQLSLSALFAKFCIREIHMSELNVMCSPDFSDHDLNGRALDEDAIIDLSLFPGLGRGPEDQCVRHEHQIGMQPDWRRGREGLVCGMGSAESLNAAACHDVMSPTSFDSDKFGCFGGAVVSSFIFHRKESCQICRCCKQLSLSALFAKFCIREIHMSELNVMCSPDFSDHDLNGRALDEDASLALSPFPGLGRGAEDKLVRHGHRFGIQRHWRRGRQGLVCGMGSAESLNAAACHDVMFSTSCDSDKFGWFGGQGELSNM